MSDSFVAAVSLEHPAWRRVWAWTLQRFPPAAFTALVAVFGGAGVAVGWATGGPRWGLLSLPVIWLFFLHLRVFDEHKDHARDAVAYPDRLLSRGVVTLPMLARVGSAALIAEVGLVFFCGGPALIVWTASYLYSLAMWREFGVGRWLSKHIVLYALSHNPVMAGLSLTLVWSTGAWPHPAHAWFAALGCLGTLGFEFGRKTRLPEEEHPGVESYTTALGQRPARAMLMGVYVITAFTVIGLLLSLGASPSVAATVAVVGALPGVATSLGSQPAKRVELGSTLTLLVTLGAVAVVAGLLSGGAS